MSEKVTVAVERRIDASPEAIFDAWVNQEKVGRFLFATPEGKMQEVTVDPRVGGHFKIVERRGSEDILHTGQYLELERPRRLVFSFMVPQFSSESTVVALDFEGESVNDGGTCLVKLRHDGVLADYAQLTEKGWQSILAGLEKVVEAG